ncbi:hypothetical protein RI367_005135 [Sorochytrium milnesiophthora]
MERVLALSLAMVCGSFVAGVVPLSFVLNDDKVRLTSALGAGLIVGTALVVIVPEGVATLYASVGGATATHDDDEPNLDIQKRHGNEAGDAHIHSVIGPAMLLGFLLMFLIEQLQNRFFQHAHASSRPPAIVNLSNLANSTAGGGGDVDDDTDPLAEGGHHTIPIGGLDAHYDDAPPKMPPTLGLIIHSFSDGVALGAASAASQSSLELIIFFAIMLHKAPSAFGLSTFLLHLGYNRRRVRHHILAFALAAPVAAIVTYICLAGGSLDPRAMKRWTGILLLFSAGSFLYVAAVHILPEVTQGTRSTSARQRRGHQLQEHSHGLTIGQTVAVMVGMLAPLFLSVEHEH